MWTCLFLSVQIIQSKASLSSDKNDLGIDTDVYSIVFFKLIFIDNIFSFEGMDRYSYISRLFEL